MTQLTEREQQMVNLYKSGVYQTKITQIMRCKRETLLKALDRGGVHVLSKSERNRVVTINPFNQNTDESYYWLGYFIADGNVATDGNKIFIISKDISHLEKWHEYCNNPNKIGVSKTSGCGVSGFCNKDVKDYLISIGVPPNKTFIVDLLIPINWSIIRGNFDGDGCIAVPSTGKRYPAHIFMMSASLAFQKQISSFLNNEGIKHSITMKDNCYMINILAASRVDFGKKMYNNASVFLERKYERYRAVLERSNNDNGVNSGEACQGDPEPSITLNG
jgi:hypothetical protein